jgi:cytochrome c oxidase subunit III
MADAAVAAPLADHFPDLEKQAHAARLGMWLFLATEIMLFTGLFAAYSVSRFLFSATFREASASMELRLGVLNTLVLITSSLTVALALHFAQHGRSRTAARLLWVTLALGATFMVVKYFEYRHHFLTGQLPGRYYTFAEISGPGASMFWALYFLMTGLHGVHVLVGLVVLGVISVAAWRGAYSRTYHTPLELGALYWHLVDLIWIFLFPLLYLIR